MNTSVRAATAEEQKYLDLAANYVGRAYVCYKQELWPEAATHFGSALESLLRIRFGKRQKLAKLVEEFGADPLFENVQLHNDDGQVCSTCVADHTRVMRNAVHPECWKEAAKHDVDSSAKLIILIYHAMVVCSSRIANFTDSPDPTLKQMEAGEIYVTVTHPHTKRN
jgi:hypothetical protein